MNWYLVIDSKKQEVSINCENIESVDVNSEDQLVVSYFLPEGKAQKNQGLGKFIRKQAIMECCENTLILKTYTGIRKQLIEMCGGEKQFKSRLKKMKEEFEVR